MVDFARPIGKTLQFLRDFYKETRKVGHTYPHNCGFIMRICG